MHCTQASQFVFVFAFGGVGLMFGAKQVWFLMSVFAVGTIGPAQAADDGALYRLACLYDREVGAFEKTVLGVRGIDRNDERLVDRLDDEAARLRLAAKNPRHFNRLVYQWREVQELQAQSADAIFGRYTPNQGLINQWERVLFVQSLFEEELILRVENPRNANSVRRLDQPSARRQAYLGSATGGGVRLETALPFTTQRVFRSVIPSGVADKKVR